MGKDGRHKPRSNISAARVFMIEKFGNIKNLLLTAHHVTLWYYSVKVRLILFCEGEVDFIP